MQHSLGNLRYLRAILRYSLKKMPQLRSCACREEIRTRHSLPLERRFVQGMPQGAAFAAGDERGMRRERSFAPHSLLLAGHEVEGMRREGPAMLREGQGMLREGQEMPREGWGMRFAERFLPLRRALDN